MNSSIFKDKFHAAPPKTINILDKKNKNLWFIIACLTSFLDCKEVKHLIFYMKNHLESNSLQILAFKLRYGDSR
jgi:hypothetical protein